MTSIGSNFGDNINGSASVGLTPKNYNVCVIGDSLAGQCSNPANGTENQGFLSWALRFSGNKLQFKLSDNYGVGGATSLSVKSQVVSAIDGGAGICLINVGGNDRLSAAMTYEETSDNLTEIRDSLVGAGVIPIFLTPPPVGDSSNPSAMSSAQREIHLNIKRFVLNELNNGLCYVVDTWTDCLADRTSTTAEVIAGYTHDGTHWIAPGAIAVGKAVAPVLASLGGLPLNLPTSNTEARSTGFTKGAINPNPTMQGTAGTPGTGGSGDLADDWESGNTGAVPNVTRTFSKVTNARGDWQQVVLGGTTPGTQGGTDIGLQRGLAASITAGKYYEVIGEVEWDDDFDNVGSVQLSLQYTAPAGTTAIWDGDKYTAASTIPAAEEIGTQVMRTPPNLIPAGVTDARVRLSVYVGAGTTLAGTIRYRNITLREVDVL